MSPNHKINSKHQNGWGIGRCKNSLTNKNHLKAGDTNKSNL